MKEMMSDWNCVIGMRELIGGDGVRGDSKESTRKKKKGKRRRHRKKGKK